MKILSGLALAMLITLSSFAGGVNISPKAIRSFEATFSDAQNVVWSNSDDYYTVQFTQQGVSTYVNYDKEGNFLTSRRYYQGAKLPIDIQCKLQKRFSDKTVYGVTEFTFGTEVAYFVTLEDSSSWTKVKVDNSRSIEVQEKYKK